MFKLPSQMLKSCIKLHTRMLLKHQKRTSSALYISGDKAKENTPPLHPYLDFEGTFSNLDKLEEVIKHRKLRIDLDAVLSKYETFKNIKNEIASIEAKREEIVVQLKNLSKNPADEKDNIESLKLEGKHLRIKLKEVKQKFYPIDDEFVNEYLNLPNVVHHECPANGHDRIIYVSAAKRVEEGESHLKEKELFLMQDNDAYYMFEEAALFDVDCTHAFTDHIVTKGDFIQTSNPDFARSVILEAIGTPANTYHDVIEKDLKNKLNKAHLVGGGSFESYLPDVARLSVYPSVLPLRYAGFGRNYRRSMYESVIKTSNLYTATQNNSVNTFVATETAEEADQEMTNILNLAKDFYNELGIHFRITYVDASQLTISESLRANIEVYSPAEKLYIVVGHISNYSDFLSKRLLFTCQKNKNHNFLHIVGGPVVYVSRLIAALVENRIPLDSNKLLCHFEAPMELPMEEENCTNNPEDFIKSGIDIYKDIQK